MRYFHNCSFENTSAYASKRHSDVILYWQHKKKVDYYYYVDTRIG